MRIVINPGHGGNDCGAVGYGLKESDIAYCIGARVESYLRRFNFATKLFQYDGLQEICDTSNNFDADIFVSIHCNAFNGAARGTETYYFYNSATGNRLANSIHLQILKTFPELTDRGIKEAGYYVLANTNCPAVLVETAFIDNQRDNLLLKNRTEEFAVAIAKGILSFAGIKPDTIDNPPNKQSTCPFCGKQL